MVSKRRRASLMRRLREDRGVAMLTALLLIMVLAALSILVLGVVVSQVKPTLFAAKNTRTIYGAEAGVEAALGRIRNAAAAPDFTGTTYGNPAALPCTLSGVVDASSATYSVQIQYFAENPAGKDSSWLASHVLACSASTGLGSARPSYALISSKAQDTSFTKIPTNKADRGISMIYQFQTTQTNIAGGRIWSWDSGSGQWCLRASGTTDGSTVSYQPANQCGFQANDNVELWVYDSAYTIKLASSTLTNTPLCLTTESGGTIRLRSCNPVSYTQEWAWHNGGNATWQGQDSSHTDNGNCLSAGSKTTGNPATGDLLTSKKCGYQEAWASFSPDPAVGPGAASKNTNQIVNNLEFGRCMDVTWGQVSQPIEISYPCKQDPPNGAGLAWNHKWYYDEPAVGTVGSPGKIYVLSGGTSKYCLQTPTAAFNPNRSDLTVTTTDWYVNFTSDCSDSNPRTQWVRSTATGDKTTSYTFRDYLGRCIALGAAKHANLWSTLIVSACDGSQAQKWNAPTEVVQAKVGNYLEETG